MTSKPKKSRKASRAGRQLATRNPQPATRNLPSYISSFLKTALVPRLRNIFEFAEQEIILSEGPREDLRFKFSFAPYTLLVIYEVSNMDDKWDRVAGTGPAQGGKTFLFHVVDGMYDICETKIDTGIGGATLDDCFQLWEKKIKPVIQKSRYAGNLPTKGRGSRGGKTQHFQMETGNWTRFFGAGGSDSQRSGYTVKKIRITEADKFDQPGDVSKEADPITQMIARTSAYGDKAFAVLECTVSTPEGRIWQEMTVHGSDGRIFVKCPHCERWLYPEREQFVGWHDAMTEVDAGKEARYACQLCGVLWDEADRKEANKYPVLVHANGLYREGSKEERVYQEVHGLKSSSGRKVLRQHKITPARLKKIHDEMIVGKYWKPVRHGKLEFYGRPIYAFTYGRAPNDWTTTCGIRYNFMHNPFEMTSMRKVAIEEWRCANTAQDDMQKTNMEKALCQFRWAIPYEEDTLTRRLTIAFVNHHASDYAKMTTPAACDFTIGAIDVQKRWCYWIVYGYDTDMTRWLVDYGVCQFLPEGSREDAQPHEEGVREGLTQAKIALDDYGCQYIAVDCGYKDKQGTNPVVRDWCRARPGTVRAILGRSKSQMERMKKGASKKVAVPQACESFMDARLQKDSSEVLYFLNVDLLKSEFHGSFFVKQNEPGCIYLFSDIKVWRAYARHVCSEFQETIFLPGKGWITSWVVRGRRNDLLDCSAYAEAWARYAAYKLRKSQKTKGTNYQPTSNRPDKSNWKIGR